MLQALQAFTWLCQLAGKSNLTPLNNILHFHGQIIYIETRNPRLWRSHVGHVGVNRLLSQSAPRAVSEQTLQHPCVALAPELGLVPRLGTR